MTNLLAKKHSEYLLGVTGKYDEIKELLNLIEQRKNEHAKLLEDLNRLEIYNAFARGKIHHDKKLFKWVQSERESYNKGAREVLKSDQWHYESVCIRAQVHIKERPELKKFKYEVHYSVNEMKFEQQNYRDMYQRKIGENAWHWSWSNSLKGECVVKCTSHSEAMKEVENVKKLIHKEIDEQVDHDKKMYKMACKNREGITNIKLKDYKSFEAFTQLLKYEDNVSILGGGSGRLHESNELIGDGVKEFIEKLQNMKINIEVLA